MSEHELSHEYLTYLLDYNPETGSMIWKNPESPNVTPGREAGSIASNGRRYISIATQTGTKKFLAHRLAWFYVHGKWPSKNLSAKNGNYDDLRLENYIDVTNADLAKRGALRRVGKSGVRGVTWDASKKKWFAYIHEGYKMSSLGRYATKEEAVAARQRAEADRGLFVPSAEEHSKLASAAATRARLRQAWAKMERQTARVHGWASFEAFVESVGDVPDGKKMILVPANADEKLGPTNYKWQSGRKWDYSTREGRSAYAQAHRATNPNSHRDKELRRAFGIAFSDYERMLAEQGGVCGICKRPEKDARFGKPRWLAVDHCHASGDIRGLLCGNCNRGIGKFEDNPDFLEEAARYIRRHASKTQ